MADPEKVDKFQADIQSTFGSLHCTNQLDSQLWNKRTHQAINDVWLNVVAKVINWLEWEWMKGNFTNAVFFLHCSIKGCGQVCTTWKTPCLALNRLVSPNWTFDARFILCVVGQTSRAVCWRGTRICKLVHKRRHYRRWLIITDKAIRNNLETGQGTDSPNSVSFWLVRRFMIQLWLNLNNYRNNWSKHKSHSKA